MEEFHALVQYVRANPLVAVGAAAALVALYYLLNHKSKLSREADAHLERLRQGRADYYTKLRPPR
jgi:hypothetical protein